jgi:hypothetical protein
MKKWVYRIALGLVVACLILTLTKKSNFDEAPAPDSYDEAPVSYDEAPAPEQSVADIALSTPYYFESGVPSAQF